MNLFTGIKRNKVAAWMAVGCLALSMPAANAGLLLHYTFDEPTGPVLDQVSPPANGTLMGTAARAASFLPTSGSALDVSTATGAGNYVSCGNPAKLNSSASLSNALTITCWVNLAGAPGSADRLVDKCSSSAGFDFFLSASTTPTVQLGLFINSTTANVGKSSAITNLNQQWAFCAVTYDGTVASANARFYLGATNVTVAQLGAAVTVAQGRIKDATNELRIAATAATSQDRTPPALIDCVRIYDAVLTAAELETIRLADGGVPDPSTIPPAIVAQPASWVGYAGVDASFAATVSGTAPIARQWYLNGTNAGNAIAGETNLALVISKVTVGMSGNFYIFGASNAYGVAWSSNAVLTVSAPYDTGLLTNIWTLSAGDRSYLAHVSGNSPTDRGLAFNPATSNLLFTSRGDPSLGSIIVALDPATGAEKHFMNLSGISGGTFNMNLVRAGDDGAVYGANLTTAATTTPYKLYRWDNDDSNTVAVVAFAGDPGYGSAASGLRWGDNMAVRGSGPATQILLAPGSGTSVALLTTSDGYSFMPTILAIDGVPDHFAQYGLAFGPGTNTFWAKNSETQTLYLVQFDLAAQTGAVLHSYSTLPTIFRGIAADRSQRWIIGAATETPDTVRLYDVSDLAAGPVLADQELFALRNTVAGQPTDAAFGGNWAFVLDPANGIKGFLVNPSLPPFRITGITASPGSGIVLSWQSVTGHAYQVQSRGSFSSGTWANLGGAVLATGSSASFTNTLSGETQFYRVQGQ